MERNNKILEKLQKDGLLDFYLVALLSADNNECIEDCKAHLSEINFLLEIISSNEIENKDEYEKTLLDGKAILLHDMENFLKEY